MKLKDLADKKNKAAYLQQAINDTAEENGIDAEHLAKGKVKARRGISIAEDGVKRTVGNIQTSPEEDPSLEKIGEKDYNRLMEMYNKAKQALLAPEIQVPDMPNNGIFEINDSLDIRDGIATSTKDKNKFDWLGLAGSILPYLRPTDAEGLDPRQLSGEMYALSSNHLEPVKAQGFTPELSTPYDISYQDILNENQADYRGATR